MTDEERMPIAGTREAMALLAHSALIRLWRDADFQPDGAGCCHVCCGTCAALLFLDEKGVLDEILAAWPEGAVGDDMFLPDGTLDRRWMYRQWNGSRSQEGCGHRIRVTYASPEMAERINRAIADPSTLSRRGRLTRHDDELPLAEVYRAMVPVPHPPKNCGPMDIALNPGDTCPTCGTVIMVRRPS